MKKFYSFLLVATALLISGNAQAVNVSSLAELKAALSSGGDITLTANITTGETLQVSQITTIDGNGFCIKGTANPVFEVVTTGKIQFNNLVIYESSTLKDKDKTTEAAILIQTSNTNVTLDNVTINTVMRGINVWDANNVNLTINNSTIQLVPNGGSAEDATTGMPATDNYDEVTTNVNSNYSRGLNLGRITNSNITLNNSTIQGFFYNVNNIGGTMEGTKVVCNNSTFKGRAALNIWGTGGYYECNDCLVTGINIFGGTSESFACFVFNNNGSTISKDNTLVINGGTLVSAVFGLQGEYNEYATQYLVRALGINNKVTINNSQYTCTKDLGNQKGGLVEDLEPNNSVEINGGIYDCPNIVLWPETNGGEQGSIVINGGTFDIDVISPNMSSVQFGIDMNTYSSLEINAGNFTIENGSLNDADPANAENTLLGEGMTVVTNLDGSVTAMTTEEAANVGTYTADADITADETKSLVEVAAAKTITVKAGTTLTIGEGGLLFEDNTSKLVVEDGGRIILNGNVNGGGDASSLVIETSEGSNTALVINPNVNVYGDEHPQGTYKFVSKAYNNGSKNIYQRFGVPTFDGTTTMTWENGQNTRLYEYDYTIGNAGNWSKLYEGTDGVYNFVNKAPFTCFNMTTTTANAPGTVYTFTGSLMGNQDAPLPMVKYWNFLANSYTAPISIYELLQDIKANYGDNVSATAYIYRAEDNWWDLVNLGDYELNALLGDEIAPVAQKEIKPMQAFVLNLYNGNEATPVVSYENNVYNPALGINPEGAPRRAAANNIDGAIRMSIANSEYTDNMTLIEGYDFSEAFDNGYDAQKFMNNAQHNLYAQTINGEMGTIATNSLVGTMLSFNAVQAGVYTISFDAVAGSAYALKDNRTNSIINIEEGATYMFAAEEGVNEARFSIVGRADAPTAIGEVEKVAANQAGVYSIAGQYMGEKAILNTLPAGVYVVDGKKIVK